MIGRRLTPWSEDPSHELRELREDVTRLRERVVTVEQDVASLEQHLEVFHREHQALCAALYAELDRIEVEIGEALCRMHPEDAALREQLHRLRARARTSAAVLEGQLRKGRLPVFEPSDELKALYRQAARLMHPDLAHSAASRANRHDWMVLLNAAYKREDADAVRDLIDRFHAEHVPLSDDGPHAELLRLRGTAAWLRQTLAELEEEDAALHASEVFQLWQSATEAWKGGRDLLGERKADLQRRIEDASIRLSAVRAAEA